MLFFFVIFVDYSFIYFLMLWGYYTCDYVFIHVRLLFFTYSIIYMLCLLSLIRDLYQYNMFLFQIWEVEVRVQAKASLRRMAHLISYTTQPSSMTRPSTATTPSTIQASDMPQPLPPPPTYSLRSSSWYQTLGLSGSHDSNILLFTLLKSTLLGGLV